MNKLIEQISIRQSWKVLHISAVHGGDINQAYCVETDAGKYFMKVNNAKKFPQMFAKEARGLAALQQHFTLKVPDIIAVGEATDMQYLMLEWLQPATANNQSWQSFGAALAEMHKATNEHFGWDEDTYIASIRQRNNWCTNWPEFYTSQRIMPLIKQLCDENIIAEKEVQQAEGFCKRFAGIIPTEPPALLHGDLWSGNVMAVSVNNQVTIAMYDPDVFFGHREIDIAMTRLFGGFPTEFYTAYNDVYPLQKEWEQRLPIFHLYPLLVHAVLFGGGYVNRVKAIINS